MAMADEMALLSLKKTTSGIRLRSEAANVAAGSRFVEDLDRYGGGNGDFVLVVRVRRRA